MQYSTLALAAFVATASAGGYYNGTTAPVYTTYTTTAIETYCPGPTTLTYGEHTYTVTEATTLTITDCPCTVVKPVYTSSVVVPTHAPVYPNATVEVPTTAVSKPTATPIEANSGNKAIAFSGASLAGLLGLAAYVL